MAGGGLKEIGILEIIEQSGDIFSMDQHDNSKIYCKACNSTTVVRRPYELIRHANSLDHKGYLDAYDSMVADDSISSFEHPYEAARCKSKNKKLYDFVENNNLQHIVKINMIAATNDAQETTYTCVCYCSLCEKQVKSHLQSIENHVRRNDHIIDSRGFTKANFEHDLCEVFMKRKYRFSMLYITK